MGTGPSRLARLRLGVIDFSFDIQHGMYTQSLLDGAFAAALQVWCLGYGAVVVARCWLR